MNRTPYMGPGKKNTTGIVFKISLILLLILAVFLLFYSCQSDDGDKLDYDNMQLIQQQLPEDDAPVVVFETTLGTFKAVLYPDEAPNYCKYFTKLVNDGYYNDTHIFAVQDGVYFIGGSKTSDGVNDSQTDKTEIDLERSANLLPLKGALSAYTYDKGSLWWKKKVATSYMLFVDNYTLSEDEQKELDENIESGKLDREVPEIFEKYGGIMNWVEQYTIFGQVYDGFDVYEKICTYDVKDEDNLHPVDEIKFKKVYMSTYGENKKDEFFSIVKTEENSSQTDIKAESE